MTYEELKELTDDRLTYEQFEAVEKIYMTSESMTKQEAAKIAKAAFGKEWKAAKQAYEAPLTKKELFDYLRHNPAYPARIRKWFVVFTGCNGCSYYKADVFNADDKSPYGTIVII